MSKTLDSAIIQAISSKKVKLVVEIDDNDSKKQIVVDENYVDYDEFIAFDGKIIHHVNPDGSVE